ncbi:hypothetical protein OS31_01450 [Dickeya oryzae]
MGIIECHNDSDMSVVIYEIYPIVVLFILWCCFICLSRFYIFYETIKTIIEEGLLAGAII